MTKKKKTLAIVALDAKMRDHLVEIIKDILEQDVYIDGYSLDEAKLAERNPDLVLASGHFLLEKAQEMFPSCLVIPADRVITGYNLEALMMLAEGSRVLVVNYLKETSEGTIESLKALGITHLKYESYWQGKKVNPTEIDVAISPGMIHLCPIEIKHRINIGERGLSPNTFCQLLLHLNLDTGYLDKFQEIFYKKYFEASKKIKVLLEESEKIRTNQDVIIKELKEGVLAVNEKSEVILANPFMHKLFGQEKDLLSSQALQDILRCFKGGKHISEVEEHSQTVIVAIGGKDFYCNKNIVKMGNQKYCFYTFKETDAVGQLKNYKKLKLESKGYTAKYIFADLWGQNLKLHQIKEKAKRFAITEQTILLTGESGTGKEIMAQAIHNTSPRSYKPFVAINFAAIPDSLVESILFGYVEGAFTGAVKGGKAGVFELADGGTIFLDEIGDAPLNIQAKLLRVLQEREIVRLGGNKIVPVDVRIISATNKNLRDLVDKNLFREDLFYRLNVLSIKTLPLREMKEEILVFIERYLREHYNSSKELMPEVIGLLLNYDWPGNVRELKNVSDYMYHSSVGRSFVLSEDIPDYLQQVKLENLTSSNDMKQVLDKMAENGDIEIFTRLLEFIGTPEPKVLGRNSFLKKLLQAGYAVSEGGIKKHLNILKQMGLIESGRTKQGTRLTEKGISFQQKLLRL